MEKKRIIIMGAAGRDFHNFNTCYRNNSSVEVKAFTAAQIPNILNRKYPTELAGSLYPEGIPIFDENELEALIVDLNIEECIFSYSDISNEELVHKSAIVNSAGADFKLLGPRNTSLRSHKPIISIGATRTGCGKSQTARRIIEILMEHGLKVVAIRHPMPYGDLAKQKVQRFACLEDLKKHDCTIEEMEEYEPHIVRGNVIYAGVDYEAILRQAEKDPDGCDVILWDGGNNDFPFYVSDLHIMLADPHRAGHGMKYYPSEVNLRMADVVIINKIDSAHPAEVTLERACIQKVNQTATIIEAASPIHVADPDIIRGKKVLVIEDGPTVTHGGMKLGAGLLAAEKFGAAEIIDPRPFLYGQLKQTFAKYPDIGKLLPAMGYGEEQLRDLELTISNCNCDVVIIGTPIDLNRVMKIKQANTRVFYNLQSIGSPNLKSVIQEFTENLGLSKGEMDC